MKKFLIVIMAAILAFSLISCSSNNSQSVEIISHDEGDSYDFAFLEKHEEKIIAKDTQNSIEDDGEDETFGNTVYITEHGKKYHRESCRHLAKSKIAISLEKAKEEGYTPCSVCID